MAERKFTMKTKGESSGSNIEPLAPDIYEATCYGIYDLGEQKNDYDPNKIKYQDQLFLMFEVHGEFVEIDKEMKPRSISGFYTNSLGEKANLRKHLANWRGKQFTPAELDGFELSNILGVPCRLVLTLNNKGNNNKIDNILPSKLTKKERDEKSFNLKNEMRFYSIADDGANFPEEMTDGIKRMIMGSNTYKENVLGKTGPSATVADEPDGDIPF